jgi:hypothetical protein
VLDVEIEKLRVDKLFVLLAYFARDVLEEKTYWGRHEVLEHKGRRNGNVLHRYELSLLRVEVHVAADAVSVRVQNHEDLVVVSFNAGVLTEQFACKDDWLLLEDFRFILHQAYLSLLSPLEFLICS